MKHVFLSFTLTLIVFSLSLAQNKSDEIRLIIRGDDIGSAHAANIACIKSYQEGIMRSVEIMVPCAWFPEAAKMLAENPGLDVGVHISVTSEWENIKWGPVSNAPSLTDKNGYFFPMIWPNDNYGPDKALKSQNWKIEEIEQEMRAQIEMAVRNVPRVSHISCHMGCSDLDPKVREVYNKLAKEYGLEINTNDLGVKRFPMEEKGETLDERVNNFISALQKLEPGNTYLYVEHPGLDTPEMQAYGHTGYEDVAADRDLVTKTFTNEKVKEIIKEKKIKLISYKDLLTQ
jgi:chitin disaccharide deacetylase